MNASLRKIRWVFCVSCWTVTVADTYRAQICTFALFPRVYACPRFLCRLCLQQVLLHRVPTWMDSVAGTLQLARTQAQQEAPATMSESESVFGDLQHVVRTLLLAQDPMAATQELLDGDWKVAVSSCAFVPPRMSPEHLKPKYHRACGTCCACGEGGHGVASGPVPPSDESDTGDSTGIGIQSKVAVTAGCLCSFPNPSFVFLLHLHCGESAVQW